MLNSPLQSIYLLILPLTLWGCLSLKLVVLSNFLPVSWLVGHAALLRHCLTRFPYIFPCEFGLQSKENPIFQRQSPKTSPGAEFLIFVRKHICSLSKLLRFKKRGLLSNTWCMSVKCAFLTRSFYRDANSLRRSCSLVTTVCVLSRLAVSDSLWRYELWPARPLCPWDSPGKNTGVDCHPLRQGIFLTQGESLHLFRLQFERGITNPDLSDIPEVRIASLYFGRGGLIKKKQNPTM